MLEESFMNDSVYDLEMRVLILNNIIFADLTKNNK
jgi:hypothetical protein